MRHRWLQARTLPGVLDVLMEKEDVTEGRNLFQGSKDNKGTESDGCPELAFETKSRHPLQADIAK
jgi:hypothetical protein